MINLFKILFFLPLTIVHLQMSILDLILYLLELVTKITRLVQVGEWIKVVGY